MRARNHDGIAVALQLPDPGTIDHLIMPGTARIRLRVLYGCQVVAEAMCERASWADAVADVLETCARRVREGTGELDE